MSVSVSVSVCVCVCVSVYGAQRVVLGAQHVCDVGELGEFALKVLDVGLLALAALVWVEVEGEGWG